MLTKQSALEKGDDSARHNGYQHAESMDGTAAGCSNQRKVAADPSDSRHRIYTAEAQRAAFGKLICAETL
jgi:hypothetical protein